MWCKTIVELLVDFFFWVTGRVVGRWGWGALYIAIAVFFAVCIGALALALRI